MGQVLSFAGGEVFHGGEAVTAGRRYILAGFLYHDCEGVQESDTASASSNHDAGQRKRGGNTSSGKISISEGFRECKQQKTNAFSFAFAVDQ